MKKKIFSRTSVFLFILLLTILLTSCRLFGIKLTGNETQISNIQVSNQTNNNLSKVFVNIPRISIQLKSNDFPDNIQIGAEIYSSIIETKRGNITYELLIQIKNIGKDNIFYNMNTGLSPDKSINTINFSLDKVILGLFFYQEETNEISEDYSIINLDSITKNNDFKFLSSKESVTYKYSLVRNYPLKRLDLYLVKNGVSRLLEILNKESLDHPSNPTFIESINKDITKLVNPVIEKKIEYNIPIYLKVNDLYNFLKFSGKFIFDSTSLRNTTYGRFILKIDNISSYNIYAHNIDPRDKLAHPEILFRDFMGAIFLYDDKNILRDTNNFYIYNYMKKNDMEFLSFNSKSSIIIQNNLQRDYKISKIEIYFVKRGLERLKEVSNQTNLLIKDIRFIRLDSIQETLQELENPILNNHKEIPIIVKVNSLFDYFQVSSKFDYDITSLKGTTEGKFLLQIKNSGNKNIYAGDIDPRDINADDNLNLSKDQAGIGVFFYKKMESTSVLSVLIESYFFDLVSFVQENEYKFKVFRASENWNFKSNFIRDYPLEKVELYLIKGGVDVLRNISGVEHIISPYSFYLSKTNEELNLPYLPNPPVVLSVTPAYTPPSVDINIINNDYKNYFWLYVKFNHASPPSLIGNTNGNIYVEISNITDKNIYKFPIDTSDTLADPDINLSDVSLGFLFFEDKEKKKLRDCVIYSLNKYIDEVDNKFFKKRTTWYLKSEFKKTYTLRAMDVYIIKGGIEKLREISGHQFISNFDLIKER